jgi:hypothetical protein
MGLLNMLQNQGSVLTPYDGTTPSINPLATQQSTMHADAGGGAGEADEWAALVMQPDEMGSNKVVELRALP